MKTKTLLLFGLCAISLYSWEIQAANTKLIIPIETHPIDFTPSNESTKVYPHVILGGTGCVANVSTSSAIWAEQDIILDKGFELSEGTSFSARVISVPDASNSNLYIQNCHYNHNENTQP